MTNSNRQAAKDSLRATFPNSSATSTGQCPMKQGQVAIFPVRYAIDESPKKAGQLGPNPLPKDWIGLDEMPRLQTRTYTLRQLRDGWVYVFDRTANTFHEYRLNGHQFSRITWGDQQLNQDTRTGSGDSKPFLLYPKASSLLIAYSSAQWTWRTCERMRSNPKLQRQWMREIDLPQYCKDLTAPHSARLPRLAELVADIDAGAARNDSRFMSSTLPTQAKTAEQSCKPAIGSDQIIGSVPDKDAALLLALQDPLAVVDDLAMQLTGRHIEQHLFEEKHHHRLEVAGHIEMFAGLPLDPFNESDWPTGVLKDEAKRQVFIRDAQKYLESYRELVRPSFPVLDAGVSYGRSQALGMEGKALDAKYGTGTAAKLEKKAQLWMDRAPLREQVKYQEALDYRRDRHVELITLMRHIDRARNDLIPWLEYIHTDPGKVFLDPCAEQQSSLLIHTAQGLFDVLGQTEAGKNWLCQDYAKPKTLLGLAIYNFNSELASALEGIATNFAENGNLDPGLATSVITRSNETFSVLDDTSVRNSKLFQAMSQPARQAYDTLQKVARTIASEAWQLLAYQLLPALSPKFAPTWKPIAYALVTVVTHIDTEVIKPYVIYDHGYRAKKQAWDMKFAQLQKKIRAQTRTATFGARHEQAAANRQLSQLYEEQQLLKAAEPDAILARGEVRVQQRTTLIEQRVEFLHSLGKSEAIAQMELKGRNYAAYLERVKKWMASGLGTGLASLVAALNIWNFKNTMDQARADGHWSQDDVKALSSAGAQLGNAIMALALMPSWTKISKLSVEAIVNRTPVTTKLAEVSIQSWVSANAELSAMVRAFALRAAGMATLGVIANGVDAWMLENAVDKASASDERLALKTKQFAAIGMTGISGAQLFFGVRAALGYTAVGFFFASWILWGFFIVGVIYLAATFIANNLKREGLKLWLWRCCWTQDKASYWPDTSQGHSDELKALHEILMRPTICAKTNTGSYGTSSVQLQIALPAELAGKQVRLHPIMVENGLLWMPDKQSGYRAGMYGSYIAEGQWVPTAALGNFERKASAFAPYKSGEARVWEVNLPHSPNMDRLELEIHYPDDLVSRHDGRGYRFSIDLDDIAIGKLQENALEKSHVCEPIDSDDKMLVEKVPENQRNYHYLNVT
ncbi:T6SS effector BTH_I2691 family protein [Ectopseudomonas khazarica]|uniref:T6SS effector BTH_I2691 family protein n=1 Tax=Ectopseudomonas khazarica TaxID=2502979 RepID=UPI00106E3FA3|nr:T6SS effector BTH_I2691 family protein [Pseudomonas khazarica]